MANNYKDLKRALADIAIKTQAKGAFKHDDKLRMANESAVELFSSPNPVMRPMNVGENSRNITRISLFRVNRYLRRNGIDWPKFNWEALVEWLYEHWDEILKFLLSLLVLI